MAALKLTISCFLVLQVLFCLVSSIEPSNAYGLRVGYYDKSCPKAEHIVKKFVADALKKERSVRAEVLRLFFHDCFVRGCDGSVLLELKNKMAEKNAPPNLSLEGFDEIDELKEDLEKECPGSVSCADILALLCSRRYCGKYHLNGPTWKVETGRRDGRISNIHEANATLPSPFSDINTLTAQFHAQGLSKKDLVVLSGAHTIGDAHCGIIRNRLYNFSGKGDRDPSLDSEYADRLRLKCSPTDTTTPLELDPGSVSTFDLSYYKLVSKRRGLFRSDATLLDDQETKSYVLKQTTTYGSTFFKDFPVSMVKLGRLGVLTGRDGEIRKNCRMVNK